MDKLNFKSYTLDKVFEIKGFFSDQKEDFLSDNMLSGKSLKYSSFIIKYCCHCWKTCCKLCKDWCA